MEHVIYYRNLLNSEITKFERLCDKWNNFLSGDAPEDEKGNILLVIGQTKLLLTEKFKQFNDLILMSEKTDSSKKITADDLQGFWDCVSIQVEDINNKFSELDLKEANKWKPSKNVSQNDCKY